MEVKESGSTDLLTTKKQHLNSKYMKKGSILSLKPGFSVFLSTYQNFSDKTLRRTRKFVVDGVEVSVTTSKIISDDEKKDEEMRFLRYVGDLIIPW